MIFDTPLTPLDINWPNLVDFVFDLTKIFICITCNLQAVNIPQELLELLLLELLGLLWTLYDFLTEIAMLYSWAVDSEG